jgi:S1-C subfamily serine protease
LPPAVLDQTLGIRTALGAFVVGVEPSSPASDAGLALCDLITSLNGRDLREHVDHQKFRSVIREAAMFGEALLGVWRFDVPGESYTSVVTQFAVPASFGAPEGLATRFALMVVEAPEGSMAAAAGIRPWDFIERINGEQVSELRNVIELDQKFSEILARDGKLRLTLGRWKPLPSSPGRQTQGVLRDVVLKAPKTPRR